jgi:branched-chain amino acid transport system ATP-binding protein
MALLNALIDGSGYGSVTVLRDVGLTVEEGELVAVLGANGAGKTTLLRTISGVMVRSRGELSFEGRDIRRLPAFRRARAGIIHVPEGRHVFGGLTVAENLAMGALAARGRGTGAAYRRVHDLFPVLGERAGDDGRSLSGGQQQMLAIGRALMGEPRLLMVDEASLGLAPTLTAEVLAALGEIRNQGTSVLLVEQNARAALRVADRVYVLERGRVALAGTAHELRADERVVGLYLGGHSNTGRKQ